MKRKLFKILAACSVSIILAVSLVTSVLAIATPSSGPTINAIYAFRNVKETGDMLFLIDQSTDYTVLPAEDAYSAILTTLYDEDGVTHIATGTIYSQLHNGGYGRSIVAMYFNAANCTTNTMVWLDDFDFYVVGNPDLTWTPSIPTSAVGNVDYWASATSISNVQDFLAARIIVLSNILDYSWETNGTAYSLISATTGGPKLSNIGQAYWLGVLPGISTIAPNAFSVVVETPDIHKRTYGNQGALDLAAQLLLTPFDFTGLSTKLGISLGWLNSIIVLAVIVLIDWLFIRNHLMGTRGIILIDDFIFIATAVAGLLPLMVLLGGAVAAAFFTLNVFFLSKANV